MNDAATRVRAELVDGVARATLLHGGTYLRPRLVSTDGNRLRVALVGSYATLLAGDDVAIDVEVGPGVHLDLVEPTGMVAYDAADVPARWTAALRIRDGAVLTWRAAPFVVSSGANVTRRTDIQLDDGALALVGETLVLGRAREGGGRLHSTQHATVDGRELLVETLDLRSRQHRSAPGILGENSVLATTALLGTSRADTSQPHETRLAGPGALARANTVHAHEAATALAGTWQRWHDHVTSTLPRAGTAA